MKYGSGAEGQAMRAATSCFLCALNIIVMQDTHTWPELSRPSCEVAHFLTHTNTLARTHPCLLAVNHSPTAGTSVRPVSQFRGQRSLHRPPHSCFHLFVCRLVRLHFLESASLRPSFTLDLFFLPLSPVCSQTCFSDLSPLRSLKEP